MAAVRHLGIVLPPYETTYEVSVARRSCLSNFMSIWYTDLKIAIWIFHIFGLKCLFRPPKWGVWGLWTHKCDYSSSRPPKGTSLRRSEFFKLSTVKIRWGVWSVNELTESVTDTQTDRQTDTHTDTHTGKFMFCPCIALDRQKCTNTHWQHYKLYWSTSTTFQLRYILMWLWRWKSRQKQLPDVLIAAQRECQARGWAVMDGINVGCGCWWWWWCLCDGLMMHRQQLLLQSTVAPISWRGEVRWGAAETRRDVITRQQVAHRWVESSTNCAARSSTPRLIAVRPATSPPSLCLSPQPFISRRLFLHRSRTDVNR